MAVQPQAQPIAETIAAAASRPRAANAEPDLPSAGDSFREWIELNARRGMGSSGCEWHHRHDLPPGLRPQLLRIDNAFGAITSLLTMVRAERYAVQSSARGLLGDYYLSGLFTAIDICCDSGLEAVEAIATQTEQTP